MKEKRIEPKGLLDDDDLVSWKKEWRGMPEYLQEDLTPLQTIKVHFKSEKDRIAFSKLVNQRITPRTRQIWFPKVENIEGLKKVCTDES